MNDIALRETLRERLGKQSLFSRIKRYLPVDDEHIQALNDLRISPTDLNEYQVCPFKWVLERGLIIEPKQTEIETIDQKNVGTLYHHILESLFKRIKEAGDGCFHAEAIMGEYQTYIIEETREAIGKAQLHEGAFQEAVYDMLRPRITAAINDYLLTAELDGATILGAEVPLRREYPDSETALSGKSDLVLRDPDGDLIVIDFKTATLPALSELVAPDDMADAIPADVQMAAYINMLENGEVKDLQYSDKAQVRTARFYSIDNRKFRDVVKEGGGKGKYRMPRSAEEYQREAHAVDALFTQVTDTVKQGAYHAARDRHNCGTCAVSSVCRRPFIA
jgi:RecB family exonuclease